MVHTAGHRAAANSCAIGIGIIGGQQVRHGVQRAIGRGHDGGIVANGARHQRQVAEIVREHTGERADHDRGGVHHQRAVVALGVFDQVADGLAAAAAGHVLIRCGANEACIGQRLARAARGAVPAATGAAGDQKVNAVQHLVATGQCRGAKGHGCGRSNDQGATAQFQCHQIFLPFDKGGLSRSCFDKLHDEPDTNLTRPDNSRKRRLGPCGFS